MPISWNGASTSVSRAKASRTKKQRIIGRLAFAAPGLAQAVPCTIRARPEARQKHDPEGNRLRHQEKLMNRQSKKNAAPVRRGD